MKRGKIIIILIWILSLTGIFIYSKNKKEVIEPSEIVEQTNEEESLDKYEYIDYMGYYDENDLYTENLYMDEEQHFSYIKISGLKDKTLETEINRKLYNMIEELRLDEYKYAYSYVSLNAFNILSVYAGTVKDDDNSIITLNIDLTTGNEITLSDIVNTNNLMKPLSHAYYDTASFMINSQIKRETMYSNESSSEETNELIKTYENYIPTIEDEALKYARNFDINTEFYMTSAGITIPNVDIYDLKGNNEIMLYTKDNPRLFNYYYKYKNNNIYDGTYEGIKNIMLSEYIQYLQIGKTHTELIDDYALIHFDSYEKKDEENKQLLDEYIKRLDKNNFTFIYEAYYGTSINNDEYFSFVECTMTKDTYNNEVKKEFADGMLKSRNTQGHYGLKNQNISCENKTIYLNNMNVEVIYDYDSNIATNQKVRIVNDKETEEEINNSIQNELNELINKYKSIGVYVRNVTETQVFIEIDYYDNDFKRYVKELTFDL